MTLPRPQDVIIFMIGGTTYEEARTVALLNQEPNTASNSSVPTSGARLLLGGTCVHNSSTYVFLIFPDRFTSDRYILIVIWR